MITRDIHYTKGRRITKHLLDVVHHDDAQKLPVFIFIHGGSWMTGSKDLYTKFGENLLSKGFVTVIINYRLYPSIDVFGMIEDCSNAFEWVKENIHEYGGDPENIFIGGHSAGGHLSAVTGLQHNEDIKGLVLIDAFGLSAYHFLTEHGMWIPEFLSQIFGSDKERWKVAAPDALIKEKIPPLYILTGGNTYPFLLYDNQTFVEKTKDLQADITHIVTPGKSHMQMIWMFESKNAKAYDSLTQWMKDHSSR
jgi:acetyl esterase/lipase